ncbi:MAG: polyprenyl synthetase family protein [Candidatus Omnitrophota bacterium]
MKLTDIYKPIQEELVQVGREFEKELRGYDGFSTTILNFLIKESGKKLRPALALISAKAGGRVTQDVVSLATAVEVLHTATLIHDDVLDEAALRRRKESLNVRWGNDVSVVIGDYLYAKAFILLATLKDMRPVHALTETARIMCMGELSQLEHRYDFTLSEGAYLSMIERKTASLIATACELGAHLGGADEKTIEPLSRYGRLFGIAFQIIDDCLDLVGSEKRLGKSLGTDVRKGKPTLPLIYLLQEMSGPEREKFEQLFRDSGDPNIMEEIRRLIQKRGTLERSFQRARSYLRSAKDAISDLRAQESREFLVQIADYTLQCDR